MLQQSHVSLVYVGPQRRCRDRGLQLMAPPLQPASRSGQSPGTPGRRGRRCGRMNKLPRQDQHNKCQRGRWCQAGWAARPPCLQCKVDGCCGPSKYSDTHRAPARAALFTTEKRVPDSHEYRTAARFAGDALARAGQAFNQVKFQVLPPNLTPGPLQKKSTTVGSCS